MANPAASSDREASRTLASVRTYLEMIKFSHTVFALPFALISAALASERAGGWRPLDLFGVVLCMVFARTAAMGFNRWADRDVDARNPRTSIRAIPAGLLSPERVLAFVAASSVAFIASTTLFWFSSGNRWPLTLSVPILGFLLGYSYAKRFTALAHVWLGMALALAPPAAWLAIDGTIAPPALWLSLVVACWVTGFDVIYACQDIDVDRQAGLHSIPARLGHEGAMWVARAAHLLMAAALVGFGRSAPELGGVYWIAAASAVVLLFIEHWLVRGRDPGRIHLAFLYVNGAISLGLLAAVLAGLYL